MSLKRIGSDKFFKSVDKNGKPAWLSKNHSKKIGNQKASREVLEKIVEPVRALTDETSLLSHYANDLIMRLSLKIDDILDDAKHAVKQNIKHVTDVEWGTLEDEDASPEETEKRVLDALEKFASRLPI